MFEDERKGQLDEEALEQARKDKKRIGLVMGSWDQCHIGHIRYLKRAKEECDYLIVGVDSDEKIRKRKGPNRPLIPEDERYDTIKELGVNKTREYEPGKSLADDIVFKPADEKKWELIKKIKPDVLVAIPENYSMEDVDKLTNEYGVGRVAVFGRQAETSSSEKLRRQLIANMADKVDDYENKLHETLKNAREKFAIGEDAQEPLPQMMEHLGDSTDWITPVVAAAKINDKWYFGTNQCDYSLSKDDLNNRSELFYSTVEHAEINLLKRISKHGQIDTIFVSLFPCDKCLKTLIDKGVKNVYYLEDHPEKNWSKRSHELAEKKGINIFKVTSDKIIDETNKIEEVSGEIVFDNEKIDYSNFKYVYPPNTRHQEQLDIMMTREANDEDPLAQENLDPEKQPVLFEKNYWYVTENRFPYDGAKEQFLIIAKEYNTYPTQDMWNELYAIIEVLKEQFNILGGAFLIRFGDCYLSGASLKRTHCHLIMPEAGKKVKPPIGGKNEVNKELKIMPLENYKRK